MTSFFRKRALVFFLLFLAGIGALNMASESVRSSVSSILAPVQGFLWKGGTASSGFLAGTFGGANLEARVRILEDENLALLQKLLSLAEVKKENARLREALDIAERGEWDLLLIEIIGKESGRDVLIINKGRTDGVREGMPVITQSGVAVGSVEEARDRTSRVSLLSLEGRLSDVKIQDREAVGVLKGQGGFKALLDFIPQEEGLTGGDLVVTSALGGVFPGGFLIGELGSVEKSDIAAFQGGSVSLFFHAKKENSLFIITNYP